MKNKKWRCDVFVKFCLQNMTFSISYRKVKSEKFSFYPIAPAVCYLKCTFAGKILEFGPNLIFYVLIILLTIFRVCVRKWSEKTHKFSGNVKKVSTGNFSGVFYLKKSGRDIEKNGERKRIVLVKKRVNFELDRAYPAGVI